MSEAAAEVVNDAAPAEVTNTPIESAPADWRDSLPEGVKNWQEAQQSTDPDMFWQQMEHMRSSMGNSLRIPSEDAGQETWDEFKSKIANVPGVAFFDENDPSAIYDRMGRPQDANAYQFSEVEGFDADPESEGAFRKVAHEAGLNSEQADKIHQWLATSISADAAASKASFDADIDQLRGEWGAKFEHNTGIARQAVNVIEQNVSGFREYLEQSGAGNSGQFIRAMAFLGNLFGEQGAMQFSPTAAMSPHEARLQISDIRNNPSHPFNNELDPGHEAAKQKVMELYKYVSG